MWRLLPSIEIRRVGREAAEDRLNEAYDRLPPLSNGEWVGNAQRCDYTKDTGFELHNLLDCDDRAFEFLIDHPSWIHHVRHYAGEEGPTSRAYPSTRTSPPFDTLAVITQSIPVASSRRCGRSTPISTVVFGAVRSTFSLALTDIGPGDGATMVIPGSHKSNLAHPLAGDYARGDRMDALPGAVEVHAKAGEP